MTVRPFVVALLAAALAPDAAAQSSSPQDLVARAVSAMGGAEALRGLNGVAYDFHLAAFGLGQSELPESPLRATVSYGRSVHDYRGSRRAVMQETRLLTGAVTRQRSATTTTMGMNETNGQQAPMGPGAVVTNQRLMRFQPERLLLTALDEPGSVSAMPARTFRGFPHDGIRIAGTDTLTVWFDRVSGLPVVLETVADDPVLGDRATQTWLTRWQPAGAVRLPRQVDVMVNGQLTQHIYYPTIAANPPLPESLFAIADSIARRAQPIGTAPAALVVTLSQLAPFVWRAEGNNNYRSLIVEQPDQVVVVEAPFSTEFSRAVLDSVRGRFPGKRVGAVAMTHYHFDHSGGIREYIAENIPVVTLADNAAFVRQVAGARRTVRPDLQAQRRRNPQLRTFTDSTALGEGDTRVVLYRQPSIHAEGILSAWVPGAGIFFTADVVNPPAAANAPLAAVGSAELVALAQARGLRPTSYAGAHGPVRAWADVERAAASR